MDLSLANCQPWLSRLTLLLWLYILSCTLESTHQLCRNVRDLLAKMKQHLYSQTQYFIKNDLEGEVASHEMKLSNLSYLVGIGK